MFMQHLRQPLKSANKAAQGDPVFIRIALPLEKSLTPTPEFEMLPEDAEVMKQLEAIFKDKEKGEKS